ncbi:hypothetical protein, partial [Burkholderia glumae]|uniref:hypothetical protein n=1 Tax=Burkholderia glumae TaxID=337 RepID=UPI0020367DF3
MSRAYLADAGFVLLDREWYTVRHRYRFQCADKHISLMSGANLMLQIVLSGLKSTLVRVGRASFAKKASPPTMVETGNVNLKRPADR